MVSPDRESCLNFKTYVVHKKKILKNFKKMFLCANLRLDGFRKPLFFLSFKNFEKARKEELSFLTFRAK